MTCPICGIENADTDLFCKKCGTPIKRKQPEFSTYKEAEAFNDNSDKTDNNGINSNNGNNGNTDINAIQRNAQMQSQPQPASQQTRRSDDGSKSHEHVNMNKTGGAADIYEAYRTPISPEAVIFSKHPVLNDIKALAASPLFITVAVGFSAAAFLYIINLISSISNFSGTLGITLASLLSGSANQLEQAMNIKYITDAYTTVNSFIMILFLLLCVGFWITYISAYNKNKNGMSPTGITIIKIVSVILLTILCIGMAVIAIVCIYASSSENEILWNSILSNPISILTSSSSLDYTYFQYLTDDPYSIYRFDPSTLSAAAVVFVIIAALLVIFIFMLIKTINTVRRTILTGVPSANISRFVAVMCCIAGGVNVLASIPLSNGSLLAITSSICLSAALIAAGAALFEYRKKMLIHVINYSKAFSDAPRI